MVVSRKLGRRAGLAGSLCMVLAFASAGFPHASDAARRQADSARAPVTRATTIGALNAYPLFFHGQSVRVRATQSGTELTYLVSGEDRILTHWTAGAGSSSGELEVAGTFWDVGRLEPNDPRVAAANIPTISERLLQKPWPGIGELVLFVARVAMPAQSAQRATLRALALEPARFEGQRVTVTGRFRGRNLYGDLPTSPGQRFEFVLQSGDAAVWITGMQPKGDGFNFNPSSRLDTSKWLKVSGSVKSGRGLTWIEATSVALATPAAETSDAPEPAPKPVPEPPPEVLFSLPTQEETDVARDIVIRIQFSRDMKPESFRDRVRLSYVGAESMERGEPQAPATEFVAEYDRGNRSLAIRPKTGLERFRTVRIDLLDGIEALDGSSLKPWTLTFVVGG